MMKKIGYKMYKQKKNIAGGLVNQRISEATIETAVQEAMQGLVGGTYSVDEAAQHIQDAQDAL